MSIDAPEVPNGGAPDPRVNPAPQNPEYKVSLAAVFDAIAQFSAAHPEFNADLERGIKEAMAALEGSGDGSEATSTGNDANV